MISYKRLRPFGLKGKNCFSCEKYYDSCSLVRPVNSYLQLCRYVYAPPVMGLEIVHSLDQILLDAYNVAYRPCRRRHVHHRRENSGNMYCLECRKCSTDTSVRYPALANYTLTSLLWIFPWCGRGTGVGTIDPSAIDGDYKIFDVKRLKKVFLSSIVNVVTIILH